VAKETRIFLIEKSSVIRTGLKALLAGRKDVVLVGEAASSKEAVGVIRSLRPDLILLNMKMEATSLIESCKTIRSKCPNVKIIVMTRQEQETEVFAALAAGADGYCLKEVTTRKLLVGIRTVAEGDFWLDSAMARHVVKALLRLIKACEKPLRVSCLLDEDEEEDEDEDEELSEREVEVLELVARGFSNSEIAESLIISTETVKSHIRKIMKKLVVTDRTQAAVKAIRQGLI